MRRHDIIGVVNRLTNKIGVVPIVSMAITGFSLDGSSPRPDHIVPTASENTARPSCQKLPFMAALPRSGSAKSKPGARRRDANRREADARHDGRHFPLSWSLLKWFS